MKRPLTLVLSLSFLLPALAGEPVALFDGKTFSGWEGNTAKAGDLFTAKEYGDFELTLKWRLEGTEGFVNGGVQIRSKRIPDHHEMIGYQADLGAGYDGALYDESRRKKMLAQPSKEVLAKCQKPLGEWNEYRIRAEGPRIQLWLNGVQTVDYTEAEAGIEAKGLIAVQIHGNGKTIVRFRNLTIDQLPD